MQLSPQAFPFVQTLQQPAATTVLKADIAGADIAGADIAGAVVDIRLSRPVAMASFHIFKIYPNECAVARVNQL